jgi:hypothetical protein
MIVDAIFWLQFADWAQRRRVRTARRRATPVWGVPAHPTFPHRPSPARWLHR